MVKNSIFNYKNISEILIIILPICLLFSNFISEIIVFGLIFISLLVNKWKFIKLELNDLVFFLLILIFAYLIVNYFINIDKNPSVSRSFFFIRFILYAYSFYFIFKIININLKKIFKGWAFVLAVISFDIFFQYKFGKNIFGYNSIYEGNFYRLGGFLNDELKIANLIIYFFVPVFAYFHSIIDYQNKKKIFLLLLFFFIIYTSVFLTGERSNFISFNIFIFFYALFTNLRKYFFVSFAIFITIIFFYSKTYEPGLNKRMTTNIYQTYKKNIFENNEKGFFYKNNQYFAHYSAAAQIGVDYPFFGVGLKNFRIFCRNEKYDKKIHPDFLTQKCSTHPHNFFFEILSELGIIGLLIFILVFSIILFKFIKLSFKESNYFLYGNSLLILVYFVPFLPRGSFFTNWNAIIFWTIFGLSILAYKTQRKI